MSQETSEVALEVMRQAVCELVRWAGVDLSESCYSIQDDCEAIARAKELLFWTKDSEIKPLRLLFDSIKIDKGQEKIHYCQPQAIADSQPHLPYPLTEEPNLQEFKQEVKSQLEQFNLTTNDWNNLNLLTLIVEKFGSFISFTQTDVALIDVAKSTSAIASGLASSEKTDTDTLYLVSGDLSGIQNFIYTISSDGALKSLRARSFYLELVTEEVVQQVLETLALPRTSIIYAGGGNLYVLAPYTQQIIDKINFIKDKINKWLLKSFQGKVFLALDVVGILVEDLKDKNLSKAWQKVPQKLAQQKLRKFDSLLAQFLQPQPAREPCKVCHRDDTSLKPLNYRDSESSAACWLCRSMFELGSELLKVKAIARLKRTDRRQFSRSIESVYIAGYDYYLFPKLRSDYKNVKALYLINNWDLKEYRQSDITNLLLGNYGKETEIEGETGFMSASEMTEKAKAQGGIGRVGYLRMDVDNLGKIFANGLEEKQNLSRLASLSRQMTYFFKVYLNSLAKDRKTSLLNYQNSRIIRVLTSNERQNLLFIYAGGDDLFISGAWNEVVEFGIDVYQAFRAYTGNNPDLTLSGGISLANAKYPLYQAADESGEAEEKAKANGRDSLGLFGEVFKWHEWLGKENVNLTEIDAVDTEMKRYLGDENQLKLLGILPIVKILKEGGIEYSQNFIRNLLITAQIQEIKIEEIEQERKEKRYDSELKDIRYFLHLPQIAYTLSRLPHHIKENEEFQKVSTSLKSPYNAPYYRAIATWLALLNRSTVT